MTNVATLTLGERYERMCRTPSDIVEHLPRFVELVKELDAKHVIELGTRSGVSTIAWLYALEGRGRLTSVDIDDRPDIGGYEHWTFIQGDDCDPDVIRGLEPAEIVFIDTSHLYEHTVRELSTYRRLVKPGGRMVLHDTMLERPDGAPIRPRYPVMAALSEFVLAEKLKWSNDPKCWGLGEVYL